MQQSMYLERWSDAKFLSDMEEALKSIFVLKRPVQNVDLRGLVVGLDGAIKLLLSADFMDVNIKESDISYAKFSCAFGRANIGATNFKKSFFDTCWMKNARFTSCSFDKARLDSSTLDDSVFLNCSFAKAKLTSRGLNQYGGRRVVFEQCDFSGARLQNLQLRACTFRNCIFEETLFNKCLMVGIKFEGQAPANSSFVS